VLILGTIPSPKSREMGFYYGHPQNCFWKTIALVLEQEEPIRGVQARKEFLLRNRIALWDVLHSCEIEGASDSSIKEMTANSFRPIIEASEISAVFATGKKASAIFNSMCAEEAGLKASYLPSTSPANRAFQIKPEFMEHWLKLKPLLMTHK
jgi:hypoxanthine-DNA glycosylase